VKHSFFQRLHAPCNWSQHMSAAQLQAGYSTGTVSLSECVTVLWPVWCRHKAEQDHPMVAAMKACGAILLGKTNMHELGVSPLGLNMHYGITRNPHNPGCFAGGSSSGSAAVVAAGLCPFAIGEKLQRTVAAISLRQAISSANTCIIVDCEVAAQEKKTKGNTTPFGISLMRSQVLFRAAQCCSTTHLAACVSSMTTSKSGSPLGVTKPTSPNTPLKPIWDASKCLHGSKSI